MGFDLTDTTDVAELHAASVHDAPSLVGRRFVSPWFVIDRDRADQFEHASYFDSYRHPAVDASPGYGDDLVEGFYLLALCDVLMNSVVWCEPPWIGWNYGLDRARFGSVVRLGDRIRLTGHVIEAIDRGDQGHLLVFELTGEVDGRDRPGFVAMQRVLWST